MFYILQFATIFTAFDQHGIPVGLFHKGHWFDASNTADQRCPSNQFPSNTDQANKRYPIFDIIDCNKHPPMPDIGVSRFKSLLIYIFDLNDMRIMSEMLIK